VLAEFPPFEQTVESFDSEPYVQARNNREGNEYLGVLEIQISISRLGGRADQKAAAIILSDTKIAVRARTPFRKN
jgi:hypothetical protein